MSFFNDLDKLWEQKGSDKDATEVAGDGLPKRWFIIAGVVILLLVAAVAGKDIYTEWLWFESLGFSTIYATIITTRIWLFLAGLVISFIILGGNLFLARRLSPPIDSGSNVVIGQTVMLARRILDPAILGMVTFLSIIFGLSLSGNWETVLRFSSATDFGIIESFLGRDVGFYIFNLPFYQFIQGWAMWAVIVTLFTTAAIYGLNLGFKRSAFTTPIKAHLLSLGSIIFFLIAWSYRLRILALVYSQRGVIFGAGYTDVHAQKIAWIVLIAFSIICGLLLIVSIFRRWKYSFIWPVGIWLVVVILVGNIYPSLIQRFQVEPSELAREKPYIEHNIEMTRLAFGLGEIEEKSMPVEAAPSSQDIASNDVTINNIRLWDYRPLRDTYNQIQAIRLYYDFVDIDVDRYVIEDSYRQVLLGARELSPEKLSAQAQTWVNRHLQFTHGYGIAMSPVNEISEEGLPNLWVKDLPPIGNVNIERPEIYHGENTNNYVITNTNSEEFDYPKGDTNVYTKYTADSGIKLDSFLRKVVFAWELRDINILISGELTPESQLLYRRNIQERISHIAPFLKLDSDPYIVIDEGKLLWIQDAYTTSNRYPYSQPSGGINYIRNSVKVVIDAYDGSVIFYLIDPDDALANTYGNMFPSLFTPIEEMPASLKAHMRYPQDLFQIQASMYATYHMKDSRVFYNKEDLWAIPTETYGAAEQTMEPYYVIMELPDEEEEEFLLMLPFTPNQKDNMITWLAARSDGDNYGKLLAYNFPKDKLIYGPRQIEARIDQDPVISSQLTLWGQKGSDVIRGNLLVIPIENSVLYVEPIYLRAERGQLPELKRVIVISGNRIVMEPTLAESLIAIYGDELAQPVEPTPPEEPAQPSEPEPSPPSEPAPSPEQPPAETLPDEIGELAKQAQEHYDKAQEYLKNGDWARWGEELKKMEEVLNQLAEIANQ